MPITTWVEVAGFLNPNGRLRGLVEFNGKLYSAGSNSGGELLEWNGVNAWIEVAPILNLQAIYSLAVFNGEIFGGTGDEGRLHKWNGVNAWIEVATKIHSQTYILALCELGGNLYGGTSGGLLFKWNGVNAWVLVANKHPNEDRISSLCVFNGKLFCGTSWNVVNYIGLFRFENTGDIDNDLVMVGYDDTGANQQTMLSLCVFDGNLYGGTGTVSGLLLMWDGIDGNLLVRKAGNLGGASGAACYSLVVFNSELYGGMGGDSRLYKWNGINAWVNVALELNGQKTVNAITVFNSNIYGVTGNSGRLFTTDYVPPSYTRLVNYTHNKTLIGR